MTDEPAVWNEILSFWFGDDVEDEASIEAASARWFGRDDAFDAEIARRFGSLPERARAGELDDWRSSANTALALVLVLDQFPRNLHRDSADAFRYDGLALEIALAAIEAGFDEAVEPVRAPFFYLPLEHAEDLAAQDRCVALFERLQNRCAPRLREHVNQYHSYAVRHRNVILRFGRFPHRNAHLQRSSSEEERAYLAGDGERFGG
jgi:uncharacterized protein (DUF924 family)